MLIMCALWLSGASSKYYHSSICSTAVLRLYSMIISRGMITTSGTCNLFGSMYKYKLSRVRVRLLLMKDLCWYIVLINAMFWRHLEQPRLSLFAPAQCSLLWFPYIGSWMHSVTINHQQFGKYCWAKRLLRCLQMRTCNEVIALMVSC